MNTMMAVTLKDAASCLINLLIDSIRKFMPISPSKMPIIRELIISTLPCPKGCFLSGGLEDTLKPSKTIKELRVSDSVCQASAIMATEAELIPTQYFRAKRAVLIIIDTTPSK
ncbi:hypothetical protein ES703_83190 [subsurface metagenome]